MDAELTTIPLERIALSPSAAQVERRKRFDRAALDELAESIRAHGVLQPIIVRRLIAGAQTPKGEAAEYELVAGERRHRAAVIAGLEEIPAVVRTLSAEQVIEIQLIENLQRADVHPMQEAEGYHELVATFGHPVEEIHARVGRSRSYVYGRMKLLALSQKGRAAFYDGKINASVALLLARIPVEKLQDRALDELTRDEWRYRRAAEHIQQHYMLRLSEATFPVADADLLSVGPCGTCPKRTGNQPELFGDVKGADVCTDPTCFESKTRAHGQRQIDKARAAGQPVLVGQDAIKVIGGKQLVHDWSLLKGYRLVKGKAPKNVTLLRDPVSGVVHKVVAEGKAVGDTKKSSPTPASRDREREKEQRECAFRKALWLAVRPHVKLAPSKLDIARMMQLEVDYEGTEGAFEDVWKDRLGKRFITAPEFLEGLTDSELDQFVSDCMFANELVYHAYRRSKPTRLLAAAAEHSVDVAAIKRQLTPKKGKKKAAKKARKS